MDKDKLELRAHPDYSDGYFAGLNDQFHRGDGPAYEAGYVAGCRARTLAAAALRSHAQKEEG